MYTHKYAYMCRNMQKQQNFAAFNLISHGRKDIGSDTFTLTRNYFAKLFSLTI